MNPASLHARFASLYEANADAIFRFCLVRVSDREQALDLVQETFSRLWRQMSAGADIANERAFAFKVAHNLIIDWYRKKKAVSLEGMADEETEAPYERIEDSAAEDLKLEAEGRFLLDAIGKIQPSNRRAVYLRFVEGLSPPDIGEILGISANAASVRVNRGIAELRKITGYGKDGLEMEDEEGWKG